MPSSVLGSIIKGVALLAASAHGQSSLAGRWVHTSVGQELVIRPQVKLTPYAAPGYGTNLGGSAGHGSATNTVVTTEATPVRVEREMALNIAADGSFTWSVKKREDDGASCVRTVQQQRRGRATFSAGYLVLAVSGGREAFSRSCGGSGETPLPAVTERYRIELAGGEMVLSSGPIRWRLERA